MRTIKIFLIFSILGIGFTVNAMGQSNGNNGNHYGQYRNGNNGNHNGAVGAPLDGGLLSVLGAGGIAYYVARRKNKKMGS